MINLVEINPIYEKLKKNNYSNVNIAAMFKSLTFRSFIDSTYNINTPERNVIKFLKENGLYKTTGARDSKKTFIDEVIYDYLEQKLINGRKEPPAFKYSERYIKLINTVFKGVLPFITEYKVLNYRVDVYFDSLNLCVEFDEPHHNFSKNKDNDLIREEAIKEHLKCTFIRVKIGEEIESINRILCFNKADNIIHLTNAILKVREKKSA